jgi:heme/copper-type cytochrome/quinol oxidase subunit 2
MFPTAASEMIEQAVKVGVGLLFAWWHRDNVARAVVYLLLAVTISELVALVFMLCVYRIQKRKKKAQKTQKDGGNMHPSNF